MSDQQDTDLRSDGGFLNRWSSRKLADQEQRSTPLVEAETAVEAEPQLTDEDMPPVEELTEESDFTGFLSPDVSEELRQKALRKLFMGAVFNDRDGLDDYDDDFTEWEKLGDIITADMRHQMEMAKEKLEAMTDEESEEITDQSEDPEEIVEDEETPTEEEWDEEV